MMESGLSLDPIRFPLLGNSIVVGIASLLHILLASPAVAFMVLAPVAELFGRKRPHYTEFAHTMTRFTLITYTASLVLAVIMVELFIGLFPLTNSWLFNRFRVAIGVAIAAFLLQLVALYPYYHYWDAIRSRSMGLHLSLGVVAALGILVWVTILDGIGSYMLTPGDPKNWSFLNPTFLPLVVHRFFGDVVVAGYLAAGYASWRMRRAAASDLGYYRHMATVAMLFGAMGLLLQPLTGYVYAQTIHGAAPAAYQEVVSGQYQPLVYLQFTLIALLFLGTLTWLRLQANGLSRWPYLALVVIALLMVFSVGHPALRRFWTVLLAVSTAWILWASRMSWTAEDDRPLTRWLTVGLAGCAVLIYLTMGTIRETARHPDTIRGIISLQEEAETPAAFREPPGRPTDVPAEMESSR